ncbi:serine protease inhibitor 3/4-like [Musca vetustissima]|uniref:serine protease inhibitor 3/4-like n=1 Tax=Musca vetustissima TaxID=27455 RepID=UPI002AB659F9|nr:serine protease inhibitor 3/4-like [Musca vetustissima]
MGANTHFIATICFMILSVIVATPTSTTDSTGKGLQDFATKLYSKLAKRDDQKNIIFSPFSIETILAMIRMGASGQTAEEIDNAVRFNFNNNEKLETNFKKILSVFEESNYLKMANKIYVAENVELRNQFSDILTNFYYASAENVNFTQNIKAAEVINSWVAAKTNNLITDLIGADDLDKYTRLVLLNAIYFKDEWAQGFPENATRQQKFYVDETDIVNVDMMHMRGLFRYGRSEQLDAAALELPYKNSDLRMLIILPNSRYGLEDLRNKLNSYSLEELRGSMFPVLVDVAMPKFKAEYTIELKEILQQLGIERLFSHDAELMNMLNTPEPIEVSKVLHKAFIEVSEKGTEAAASTGSIGVALSSVIEFVVDHGFFYKIIDTYGTVYFEGSQKEF